MANHRRIQWRRIADIGLTAGLLACGAPVGLLAAENATKSEQAIQGSSDELEQTRAIVARLGASITDLLSQTDRMISEQKEQIERLTREIADVEDAEEREQLRMILRERLKNLSQLIQQRQSVRKGLALLCAQSANLLENEVCPKAE